MYSLSPAAITSGPETGAQTTLALAEGISRGFLLRHQVCPIGVGVEGELRVAVTTTSLREGLDDLSLAYGKEAAAEEVAPQELQLLIEVLTCRADVASTGAEDEDDDARASDIRDLANQPPVVRYVNVLLREASDAGASDIHIESVRGGLEARLRMDGVLLPTLAPPGGLHRAVVSRIKLLADLDIAERRRPQDGRIRLRLDERDLDVRVSTVPTMAGESVVMRLLDLGHRSIGLEEVGMAHELREAMEALAQLPNGLVLATGPTGCGKTTTLYAALGLRNASQEKIITVEDPIEYSLGGVQQVPVHRQVGVTFATMLRSILRQDPDVLMVGEMRDAETADLAVQAALTGHVVFSTLHTNDAVGAVARLRDLGVPSYLIAATVQGVLAQRLVRRICEGCRSDERGSPGRGCAVCRGTGYRGRIGLFELLVVTPDLREAIVATAPSTELREIAARAGWPTLSDDGSSKVAAGVTTWEEVRRVTRT